MMPFVARRRRRREALRAPELASLPPEQRLAAYRLAHWRSMRRPSFWLVKVAAFVLILAGLTAGQRFFVSRFNPGIPLPAVMIGAALLAAAVILLVARWWRREVLARELWRHMPETCAACGYDLRGNASGVCPECGGPVEPPPAPAADAPPSK